MTLGVILWAVAITVAAVPATAQPTAPEASFVAGNRAYAEARYEEAARAYRQVVVSGQASAAVYFNLGNAYFKLGRRGEALLNYERAARLAPADPDIEANLAFAREASGATVCERSWWQRLTAPFADTASASRLFTWLVVVFSLVCAVLAAHGLTMAQPRALLWLAGGGGVLAALLLTSLVARLNGAERAGKAIVVRDGSAAVRFEPAAAGTVHFEVTQGTPVTIHDRREGWLQVERCDGRRGWVERSALAELDDLDFGA